MKTSDPLTELLWNGLPLPKRGPRPTGSLAAYTERTIVDQAVLEVEVARARERGWAEAATPITLDDWERRSRREHAGELLARLWKGYM